MGTNILMHEPEKSDYIFIDKSNNLHVLLPIVSGENIGLDNTCKTHLELKQFFGLEPGKKSAKIVLSEYKKALLDDIELLTDVDPLGSRLKDKKVRLAQIIDYIDILTEIERSWQVMLDRPNGRYPVLPDPVRHILKKQTNCLSMRLSPKHEDRLLRTESPVFSVARRPRDEYGAELPQETGDHIGLGPTLRQTFSEKFKAEMHHYRGLIDQISDAAGRDFEKPAMWTDDSIAKLIQLVEKELEKKCKASINCASSLDQKNINKAYFETIFSEDFHSFSAQEVAHAILQASISDHLWMEIQPSVFTPIHSLEQSKERDEESERLSIKTQFFLAQINIYCHSKNILNENINFGKIFDQLPYRDEISEIVFYGVLNNISVEESLFMLINYRYKDVLKLKRPLLEEEQKK